MLKKNINNSHWYVLRTKTRAEKQAFNNLTEKKINTFLPLIKTLRKWSDRKKCVEIPLFNSYIFVYISEKDFEKIRFIPGIIGFITFEGKPAIIPDKQIKEIKQLISSEINIISTEEKFEKGQNVIIKSGPLKGIIGELAMFKGSHKVILRIEQINQVILFEVALNKLAKIENQTII